MIQKFLPLLPEGARLVNNNLAIFRAEGEIIFFNGYCPMLKCSSSDSYEMRLAKAFFAQRISSSRHSWPKRWVSIALQCVAIKRYMKKAWM